MDTSMSGRGRHRRRIRIAVPFAAATLAAAVGGALLMSSANAATGQPTPITKQSNSSPSLATLKKRIAGAVASDGAAGQSANTKKSSLSASTSARAGTGALTGTSATAGGVSVDPKIIGGTTTAITTAPWMAQLWYLDDKGTSDTGDDFGFFCGGSVVSPTKILTAAHCVKDEHGKSYNWAANGAVVTGTAQLPTDGGTNLHGGTATAVLRQWNHPSYSATTINNDIAVLTLDNPVTAKPIRMTTSDDTASYVSGTKATLYGWGRTTSTTNDVSETLKTATLPIKSDATCSGFYGSDFIKGHMVCAGNPATGSDTGTTSACNGDSGGPLTVGNSTVGYRIVGVVSWGVADCVEKGAYSVFSKVSAYVGAAYPQVDDANLSLDNKADLFVRNSSTKTLYELDSKGTSFAARQSWGNWSTSNVVLQADLNRDGFQDVVERRSSTGEVHWWHFLPSTGKWADTKIFSNWKTRTAVVAPGDVTGDALPDLLSVDSGGVLWIYPGKGNGTFSAPVKVGSGWNQYNVLRGHGDFTGDGKTDLIARSKTGSYIYLYKGTGKAGSAAFSGRVKVRTWDGYNAFGAVGDVTGDGKADFLARTPAGALYLYPGTGKATSEIFTTAVKIGTDFKQYDIFG